MLSNLELERLTESDVGRRLTEASGLTGWVRIEPRPVRRVGVDFALKVGEARLTELMSGGAMSKPASQPTEAAPATAPAPPEGAWVKSWPTRTLAGVWKFVK